MATTASGDDSTVAAEILNTILARAPSAVPEHVELAIRNTIREFLQKSQAWRDDLTFKTVVDKDTFFLNPVDAHAMVSWVLAVYLDGRPLVPAGDAVRDTWYSFRYTDTGGGPGRYFVKDASELIIAPAPIKAGQTLIAGVSLQMRPGKTSIPDFIGQQYFDGIVSGTLARLHSEYGKAYSSLERAGLERRTFLSEMKRARDIANRGYTRGAAGWSFPYFASGRLWNRGGAR